MRGIPLHLQRRFEQRWTARFAQPAASVVPKTIVLKETIKVLPRPIKAKPSAATLSRSG